MIQRNAFANHAITEGVTPPAAPLRHSYHGLGFFFTNYQLLRVTAEYPNGIAPAMRLPCDFKWARASSIREAATSRSTSENDARMFNINLSIPRSRFRVTGASKGIGASIAEHLTAEGASVVVNYASSTSGAEEIVRRSPEKGGNAIAVQADVSKPTGFALHRFHS